MQVFGLVRSIAIAALSLSTGVSAVNNASTGDKQSTSILRSTSKPPQVFKNTNLVRNVNVDKSYVRDTINVVVENTDKSPQSEYFVPFQAEIIPYVGGFEVKDRNDASRPVFESEHVELDAYR